MSKKIYYRDKKIWTKLRNIAIVFIILGVVCLALFLASPEPDYEDMTQNTIVIQSLRYVIYYRGNGVLVMKTDDNQCYNVVGEIVSQLVDQARPGTRVAIKYFRSSFYHLNYIKEMSVDGEMLVTYKDNRKHNFASIIVAVSLCEIFGAGFLWAGITYRKTSHYTKERTKELKESVRLKK